MSHSDTLELAIDLVSRDSVTPEDKGCQEVMIARLEAVPALIFQNLHDGGVARQHVLHLTRGGILPILVGDDECIAKVAKDLTEDARGEGVDEA